ncbi:MAG: hypothetical protein WCX73_01080 [Candidatus Pacearchaeota archaeon]|jgi:hypothetical protein
MKKKVIKKKEIQFPMEFNPGLKKFEPVLPFRKKSLNMERKRNWWAYVYIITWILLLAGSLAVFIFSKLKGA